MNAAISSVVKTQTSNPASANKIELDAIKSAEEITGGQNIAVDTTVSSKYDTIKLSREYLEYKTQSQNSTLNDETSQLNSTVVRYAAKSGSEEVVYSYQLYPYTETELLNMLSHAAISRQEYEAEISQRESDFTAE